MIDQPAENLKEVRIAFQFTKEQFQKSENEDKRDLVRAEQKRENGNKDFWSEVRTGPQVQVPREFHGNP
jgi:hypothetical protein